VVSVASPLSKASPVRRKTETQHFARPSGRAFRFSGGSLQRLDKRSTAMLPLWPRAQITFDR
jgi:hypothetical protein